MNKQKNAFTLIELLVVVSIIALLVSILIPALSKAKNQAEAAVCLSNLKQIGFAANYYAADNDEFIPRGNWNAGRNITWFELFMPYLGQQHARNSGDYRKVEIYFCPSYPTTGFGYNGLSNAEQTITYVINDWNDSNRDPKGPSKINYFRRPPFEVIYLADNENGDWRPVARKFQEVGFNRFDVFRPTHIASSDLEHSYNNGRRVANTRHRDDGCNILYLDWHADWLRADDMTVRMWEEN